MSRDEFLLIENIKIRYRLLKEIQRAALLNVEKKKNTMLQWDTTIAGSAERKLLALTLWFLCRSLPPAFSVHRLPSQVLLVSINTVPKWWRCEVLNLELRCRTLFAALAMADETTQQLKHGLAFDGCCCSSDIWRNPLRGIDHESDGAFLKELIHFL